MENEERRDYRLESANCISLLIGRTRKRWRRERKETVIKQWNWSG